MKKYITIAILLAVALAFSVASAHAVNPTAAAERMEAKTTITAQRQTALLSQIIQRADTMISVRLASLERLLTRVSGDKRLSDADKTELTTEINTTISGLQSLKTKIDADTDSTTARTDAKSIVTAYRVYVIFEPKIRLLTTINNLQTTASNVSSLSGRIQTLIDTVKSEGKDVTAAQTALNDINTQITAINTLLSTDKSLVTNVTVNTTDPQSIFVQVRKDLATVRADFAKIRSDIATIRSTLKVVVKMSPAAASNSAH